MEDLKIPFTKGVFTVNYLSAARKGALLLAVILCLVPLGCSRAEAQEESSLSESGSQEPSGSQSREEEPGISSSSEESSSSQESSSQEESSSQPEPSSSAAQPEPSSSLPESSSASEPSGSGASSSGESEPEEERPVRAGTPPEFLGVYAPKVADGGEYLSDVENDILWIINSERLDVGAGEVEWDDNLAEAARIRAAELYKYGYTAHKRPSGEDWNTVLKTDVPVGYKAAGEILASIETAQNYDKIESADYWFNQWKNSSTHYSCLTNGKYTHAGVGVAYVYDDETGLYYGYACTLFAVW